MAIVWKKHKPIVVAAVFDGLSLLPESLFATVLFFAAIHDILAVPHSGESNVAWFFFIFYYVVFRVLVLIVNWRTPNVQH